MEKYMNMSLEELRMLGDKELKYIADEIIETLATMCQVFDEDIADWLEELEELYTRIEYVLEMTYM